MGLPRIFTEDEAVVLNLSADENRQPDIDICRSCGEHTEFDEDGLSDCCGDAPYDSDPDIDMER